MKNKIVAFLMAFWMLVLPIGTYASTPFDLGYGIGETSYTLAPLSCAASDGVEVSDASVSISAGGRAVYNFYMPFNSRSVTIKYSGASGTTTLDTGYRTYTLELSGSGEYVLEFAKHLGIETQDYYYVGQYTHVIRELVEVQGEREFAVTSTGGITIESMVFEKELTPVSGNKNITFTMPDVSDEVLKTVSTVIMELNSPIIVVNGGRRYVNNDNVGTLPFTVDGRLYLPVNTLAKALGYYSEDIPEKKYVLLRDDVHEYIWLDGSATLRTATGKPVAAPENAIVYRDGAAWAAVRYFAELTGETVGYKDGIVLIDDKYTVNDVFNNSNLFNYVNNFFKPFKAEKKTGNTYYVAQTSAASDDNNGSIMAPFKTLAKAGSVAKAGDTVIIREGIYRETLKPQNNGTAANSITFRAADGEKVVISANDKLGKFAHYTDNIYVSSMNWDLGSGKNQLFIGEESMMEARYPNNPKWRTEGLSDLWPTRGDFYSPVGDSTVIISDTLLNQDEVDYWKGGTYVGLLGHGYALSTATIASSKKGSFSVQDTSTKWWWDNLGGQTWNYGCIIGHMNALDIGKEWVKKDDMVYFIFPEGADPATTTVEAKARQLVIDIADRKFINIEGIDTIGGSAKLNNSEMCMLNGMHMKYITHYTASNDQRDGYIDWPFDLRNANGAPQRGEVGIYVGGTDNIIVNSHIDHSAGSGIYGTGLYTYIENNVLNDCGYMASYVSGINFNTAGTDAKNKARGGYAVYNNTIYNCGRSCINVSNMEGVSHTMAPYLPMEIAYNDVHDAMVASLDTGVIYEYYICRGLDKQKSSVHHNYVYSTQLKEEENPYTFGIYHDGGSYGSMTYNNLVFNTEEDVMFTKYSIFQQQLQTAPAYNDVYNNRILDPVIGGVDALEAKHFPQEQYFYAGSELYAEEYLKNYNVAASGSSALMYKAENAVLSDGMILENGIARYTQNGQYICFPDVDFGDGADMINITVYGDKYYSCDVIEVIVGESIEEGQQKNETVQISALNQDSPDNVDISVGYLTGKQNVYIRMKDYRSLGIGGLSVQGISKSGEGDSKYSVKVYGGSFTDYDISNVTGQDGFEPEAIKSYTEDSKNAIVKNTWEGTVLEYAKIRLNKDADIFELAMGSGGSYAGQKVELYIDTLDGEPLATCTVDKTDWFDFTPLYMKLEKPVSAGVHTVYFKFPKESEGDSAKTSNMYYFGFLPVGTEISEDADNQEMITKIMGGSFDTEASVQNAQMPFVARYVQKPYYTELGLTNTKPGTVAAYKGIKLDKNAENIAIHYSSAEEYDEQIVEIRVGTPSAEPVAQFVTKGNGWESFNTETVSLAAPLEAGEYDIYLTFGGTKGSKQTCKLHWFGFTE